MPEFDRLVAPSQTPAKMFFNILATFAEFEVDLLRLRTRRADLEFRAF